MPLPYHPYNLNPIPGAENVSLDASISLTFSRPPPLLKLEIEPEVNISYVEQELIFYSGKYTFYLAEPLHPGTKYSVKVTAGQEEPPNPSFFPLNPSFFPPP